MISSTLQKAIGPRCTRVTLGTDDKVNRAFDAGIGEIRSKEEEGEGPQLHLGEGREGWDGREGGRGGPRGGEGREGKGARAHLACPAPVEHHHPISCCQHHYFRENFLPLLVGVA